MQLQKGTAHMGKIGAQNVYIAISGYWSSPNKVSQSDCDNDEQLEKPEIVIYS